jgi:hypothetical protein
MAATETQEIIRSLSEFKSETSVALGGLQAKVDGIIRRLDVSNGRIAQHERAIQDRDVRTLPVARRCHHSSAGRALRWILTRLDRPGAVSTRSSLFSGSHGRFSHPSSRRAT